MTSEDQNSGIHNPMCSPAEEGRISGDSETSQEGRSERTATADIIRSRVNLSGFKNQTKDRKKLLVSVGYMLGMGICGVALSAIGSTITILASNLQVDNAANLGTVFLTRGAGAILGGAMSAELFKRFPGNRVIWAFLLWLAIMLYLVPECRTVTQLELAFCGMGLGTSLVDTGSQLMTRITHGPAAGPWIGINTIWFSVSGLFVPLTQYLIGQNAVRELYQFLALWALLAAVFLIPQSSPTLKPNPIPAESVAAASNNEATVPRQYFTNDILIGSSVFFVIGGKVAMAAYVSTLIPNTGVLLLFWCGILVGRLLGWIVQFSLRVPIRKNTTKLYWQIGSWLVIGGIAFGPAICVQIAYSSRTHLLLTTTWIGVGIYAVANGPCIGFILDLGNRISATTELKVSIMMIGLNFGASLVPYCTSLAMSHSGKEMLMYAAAASMLIPLVLMMLTTCFEIDEDAHESAITVAQRNSVRMPRHSYEAGRPSRATNESGRPSRASNLGTYISYADHSRVSNGVGEASVGDLMWLNLLDSADEPQELEGRDSDFQSVQGSLPRSDVI